MSRAAHPGDGGPCPLCGQEMGEKIYMSPILDTAGLTTTPCRGRYWHLQYELGILEDYQPPFPRAGPMEEVSE